MKKNVFHPKHRLALGAALFAAPALALAAAPVSGPYLGLEGGVNWLNNQALVTPGKSLQYHNYYKSGWIGGLTAGYSFANGFRPELEFDFRRNDLGQVTDTSIPSTQQGFGYESAATVMGNLWYDYRSNSGVFSVIHPYLGGGVGFARVGLRHFSSGGRANDISQYRSEFAYQAGAGFDTNLTPNLVASLDWRWLQTPSFNLQSSRAGTVSTRYRSQSLMLGVRYVFGEAPHMAPPPKAAPPPPPPPPPAPVCNPPPGFKVDSNCNIIPQKVILHSVNFKFNSAQLTDAAKVTLDSVAQALKKQPDLEVEIDGYTDSTGPAAYNKKLSQHRADSVRKYLVSDGIDGSTLTAKGFGEADPIATNKTVKGRAMNRRVEFKVTHTPPHVDVIHKGSSHRNVESALPEWYKKKQK